MWGCPGIPREVKEDLKLYSGNTNRQESPGISRRRGYLSPVNKKPYLTIKRKSPRMVIYLINDSMKCIYVCVMGTNMGGAHVRQARD